MKEKERRGESHHREGSLRDPAESRGKRGRGRERGRGADGRERERERGEEKERRVKDRKTTTAKTNGEKSASVARCRLQCDPRSADALYCAVRAQAQLQAGRSRAGDGETRRGEGRPRPSVADSLLSRRESTCQTQRAHSEVHRRNRRNSIYLSPTAQGAHGEDRGREKEREGEKERRREMSVFLRTLLWLFPFSRRLGRICIPGWRGHTGARDAESSRRSAPAACAAPWRASLSLSLSFSVSLVRLAACSTAKVVGCCGRSGDGQPAGFRPPRRPAL